MIHVCAEIGINHNGDLGMAKRLIDAAKASGASSAKFQRRVPEVDVPRSAWDAPKETPWGLMPYIQYKQRMEFSLEQCGELFDYGWHIGIPVWWSVWGVEALKSIAIIPAERWKVPSAKITDMALLKAVEALREPVVMSTGGSTYTEADAAVFALQSCGDLTVCHTNSQYPCPVVELNLRCVEALKERYPFAKVGYSGHETGLATTVATVALGVSYIERHITLDRSLWGTDQAASVEPQGFKRLVDDIRSVEAALGDGVRRISEGEATVMRKLRG